MTPRPEFVKGFTIIELIVVIVLVGILAVSAGPKLLSKGEFSAMATANQYVAHLRLVQLKALNQRGVCHNSVFEDISGQSVVGLPSNNSMVCNSTTDANSRTPLDGSSIALIHGTTNALIKNAPTIVFDSNGVPYQPTVNVGGTAVTYGDCSGACKFKVSAQTSVYVCIESQGYIHKVDSSYVCQ